MKHHKIFWSSRSIKFFFIAAFITTFLTITATTYGFQTMMSMPTPTPEPTLWPTPDGMVMSPTAKPGMTDMRSSGDSSKNPDMGDEMMGAAGPQQHKSVPKPTSEWKGVEDVFGFPGDALTEGVIRFNMPRKDLHVTVGGIEIKPALALGAWAAFRMVGKNDAMVMGDLVLTEEEVAPVMKALEDGGVEVTALHNHLVGESPRILYIHMGGHGNPVKMARTIKQAIALTKSPFPNGGGAKESEDIGFDVTAVEKILGQPGKVSGGVLHFNVARAEKLTEEGMNTPPSMGMGISINFQPTGNGKAAIAGDFALTGKEVGPVMKVLQDDSVQATALHSHALNEVPRLFYMHFWANDDAIKLAKTLRRALDNTNSMKGR